MDETDKQTDFGHLDPRLFFYIFLFHKRRIINRQRVTCANDDELCSVGIGEARSCV